MEDLYKSIGKTRQDYHQRIKRESLSTAMEAYVLAQVKTWRINHPRMGSRACYYSMKNNGIDIPIGVSYFEQLLSKHGLTVGPAKKSGPYTSDGKGKRDYPNLTHGLVLNGINQLVVADITYFWLTSRWSYLFTLKDVYSQMVISLIPSTNMESCNAIETLRDWVKLRGRARLVNCIYHSDNGSQYEANDFTSRLRDLKVRISRAENCQQNGSAEQLNHIIKNMYLKHFGIRTFSELQIACKKLIPLINEQRCVKQLGNITPATFEKSLKYIPLDKRRKVQLHDFQNNK